MAARTDATGGAYWRKCLSARPMYDACTALPEAPCRAAHLLAYEAPEEGEARGLGAVELGLADDFHHTASQVRVAYMAHTAGVHTHRVCVMGSAAFLLCLRLRRQLTSARAKVRAENLTARPSGLQGRRGSHSTALYSTAWCFLWNVGTQAQKRRVCCNRTLVLQLLTNEELRVTCAHRRAEDTA